MAYKQEEFVKELNGVKAPKGFHYMPNGKLMKDADHIAAYGYINKKISKITGDLHDIRYNGEKREFTIIGDKGAIFSLFIQKSDGTFYDFKTETFISTKSGLTRKEILQGGYSFSVNFPSETVSLKTYTMNIIAETGGNIKTRHVELNEVLNADNSININKSSGSNSSLLQKILNQDVARRFFLSCIAPSKYATSTSKTDGIVNSNRVQIDDSTADTKMIGVYDAVTGSGVDDMQFVTVLNPDGDNVREFQITSADSFNNNVDLTFTPPFNGMTPHYTDSVSGYYINTMPAGGSVNVSFSITATAGEGRAFEVSRVPDISDLCSVALVTFGSSALAIKGEDTSSSTYYRWPVTNIANLTNNLFLDPARSGTGANTSTPAVISDYKSESTIYRLEEEKYNTDIVQDSITDVYVSGIEPTGDITAVDRNGRPTAQTGNITFNTQQADALKSDADVRLFGYGDEQIKSMTGMDVVLSNVSVTPTQVSTTTSSGVSNSTTIPVAACIGIAPGMSMRAVGVDPSATNPIVVSKTATEGAGNVIVSAAQTIENGQTLFFDGGSNVVTITGTVEMSNLPITDTSLYFDVERFLIAK